MRTSLVLARFAVLSTISVICALALSPTLARAEDTVAPPADDTVAGDDENFFAPADTKKKPDVPDASAFNTGEDDLKIAAPVEVTPPPPKPVVVAAGPSKLGLDLNGKTPLADNWGPAVVFTTADSVVVELPVLYAVNGAGFDGNAVSVDREAVKIAANQLRYDTLAVLASQELDGLGWAANDGRAG